MRPIRRKYRRGLPVLVHRRTGPFVRHRVLRWRPSISPRRCEVAAKARIWGPKIGSIRSSRLARLGTRALRCRERRCYRAMVPIPPNGPSPPLLPSPSSSSILLLRPPAPFTLSRSSSPSRRRLSYRHFQPPSPLPSWFSPSCLPSFLWSLFFCPPLSYPPELPRSAEEAEHDQRILLCSACWALPLRWTQPASRSDISMTFPSWANDYNFFFRWRYFLYNVFSVFFLFIISLKMCELKDRSVKQ